VGEERGRGGRDRARPRARGLEELAQLVDEPGFGAAVAMITAGVKHHVKDEEREVFPELKSQLDREQLAELGDLVAEMKKPARGQTRTRARATSS
jgi:hypothetical protein